MLNNPYMLVCTLMQVKIKSITHLFKSAYNVLTIQEKRIFIIAAHLSTQLRFFFPVCPYSNAKPTISGN